MSPIKLYPEIPIAKESYPDLYHADGSIDLESHSAKEFLKDFEEPKAFQKVGYQRSLGGFFYQFFFAIIGAAILSITYPLLMFNLLYPWPESKSYADMAGVLFAIIASIMNVPTGFAIERFLGEWRVKDTRKMIQYVRFYIWYQMLTGIFLVTGFSIFVLNFLKTGDLVWAKWLMLVIVSREYPANTGVFLSSLKGLQRFDYESWLNFFNDTFIRPLFEFGFVLWGRFILGADPRFGPLMGIAIGYTIGTYLDDFLSMGLAMIYFRKAIKPMGYDLTDCFIPRVDRDVIWSAFKFGLTVEFPGLVGSVFGTITTLWFYARVPAFLTLTTLSKVADELANLIKRGGGINIKATISEARNNNKIELTSYYVAQSWKWIFFFTFALGSILFSFMPLLISVLFEAVGAKEYVLAAAFIIPNIIATTIEEPNGLADNIILGANRPMFKTILDITFNFVNIGLLYLYLFVWNIPEMGLEAMFWFLPLWGFPSALIVFVLKWWFINREICPVKFKEFGWQSFIAPAIPALIIAGVAELWTAFVFPPLSMIFDGLFANSGTIIGGMITILFGFVGCLMFMFFPLYTAFGGNDENTLAIFHEAVEISGPSRFLFRPIDKLMNFLGKKSPLHNRFPIPWKKALEEARDLMKERYIKDKIVTEMKAKHIAI
jgi:hypothetical protein